MSKKPTPLCISIHRRECLAALPALVQPNGLSEALVEFKWRAPKPRSFHGVANRKNRLVVTIGTVTWYKPFVVVTVFVTAVHVGLAKSDAFCIV